MAGEGTNSDILGPPPFASLLPSPHPPWIKGPNFLDPLFLGLGLPLGAHHDTHTNTRWIGQNWIGHQNWNIFKDVRFYPTLNFGNFWAPLFSRCVHPIMNFGHLWALLAFDLPQCQKPWRWGTRATKDPRTPPDKMFALLFFPWRHFLTPPLQTLPSAGPPSPKKIRSFVPSPIFFPLFGGPSVEFWWCFEGHGRLWPNRLWPILVF